MIVIRNVFRLKFGKAREALAVIGEEPSLFVSFNVALFKLIFEDS